MEDQYGMVDLRQYIAGRPLFRPIPQPPDFLSGQPPNNNPYGGAMLMFRTSDSNNSVTTGNATGAGGAPAGGRYITFDSGANGGSGRWPRQETLTLLEIRSRLDSKFKEANQKGPLWDEVSRIMSEEHGYQRSGKKCREKFENLYKYYKKTKEGKTGRQDGKHYRFFRQLEALYGEPNNPGAASSSVPSPLGAINREAFQGWRVSDASLSLSNHEDSETSSSGNNSLNEGMEEDGNDLKNKRVRSKRGWKVRIRDFIDAEMKKLMDKQEAWMERMMRTIEDKEQQRMVREAQWRKQDAARVEHERELWAAERAWIEARDAAFMEALHKLTAAGSDQLRALPIMAEIRGLSDNNRPNVDDDGSDQKRRKEDMYSQIHGGVYSSDTSEQGFDHAVGVNGRGNSPPDEGAAGGAVAVNDHCFRYLMGDAYARILG